MSPKPRTRGSLAVLVAAALWSGGCADLIGGIGRPPDGTDGSGAGGGPNDGLVEDPGTGLRTTPECIEYCDDMMKNCGPASGVQQYTTRDNCISVCNVFDPGDGEATGNTLACRALLASQTGGGNAAEICPDAGPASDVCGLKCESWCALYDAACTDNRILNDCAEACESLPTRAGFSLPASTTGNSVECRVYHAGAAVLDPGLHCRHAQYWSDAFCIDTPTDEINCEVYCQNAAGACRGEFAIYESDEQCLATCNALPVGTPRDGAGKVTDATQNTVACRTYHANAGFISPGTHCPHASPMGDGTCGVDDREAGTTGNCDSFCVLYERACEAEFALDFPTAADCRTSCPVQFLDRGSISNSRATSEFQYLVATAADEDDLACHTYFAVKALTERAKGDADLVEVAAFCSKARPDAVCGPQE